MKIEVWFEFASTYSYLTVSRVEAIAHAAGVEMVWKPFLLGPIFHQKGWNTSPFNLDPAKGAYMWRDMERRTARLGLPFVRPATFPAHTLGAARIMTAALAEPWCGAFARGVFHAQFALAKDISDINVLQDVLSAHVQDPDFWLAHAKTDEIKSELRERTESAARAGIFGAPSFRVGDELFWGDDRLEDAVAWAKTRMNDQADWQEPIGGNHPC